MSNRLPQGITQIPADIAARITAPPPKPEGTLDMLPKVLNIPLPWLDPIPDAQFFNVMGQEDSVGAVTQEFITGASMTIGKGNIGVLRSFTVYVNDMLPTTDIQFTLMVAGGPAPGFGQIKMFPRTAASVANTFECVIFLPTEAKIDAYFTQVDGGTYKVGVAYSGWQYPESSGRRWMAKGPTSAGG
jgi:hypothetical protein